MWGPLERKPAALLPLKDAPFTLSDLRAAIPSHCFERSTLWSSLFVLRDVASMLVLAALTVWLQARVHNVWLRLLVWNVYALAQGAVSFGLWIIGHECGHRAFSRTVWVNDAVGLFAHSVLLTPYHSWRFTHASHHAGTAHLDRDTAFAPDSKHVGRGFVLFGRPKLDVLLEVPVLNLFFLMLMMLIGFWMYLGINAGGQQKGRFNSHFYAGSPDLFVESNRPQVVLSVLCVAAVAFSVFWAATIWGYAFMFWLYFVPYLWNNFFFITYTFLHHTHYDIPHYGGSEWTFIRGALATCDRDYGFLCHLHHRIGSTHVLHHLFKTIPHYHAAEASRAIRPVLGKYYNRDDTNVWVALVREFVHCKFVDKMDDNRLSEVYWYKRA